MVTMANTCMPMYVELCCFPKIAPIIGRPVRVLLDISTGERQKKKKIKWVTKDLRDSYNTLISTYLSPQGLYGAGLSAAWHHNANEGAAEETIDLSKNDEAGV